MDFTSLWSARANAMKASEIRELLKLTEQPDIISFAGGLPDPNAFPVAEVTKSADRVLANDAHRAFQYSTTEGVMELREAISEYLRKQGMDLDHDDIVITNGSQQGLDLLGRTLLNPQDNIVVSNPSYLGALQAFNFYDINYAGAGGDADGMDPDQLEETLTSLAKQGQRAKFMYLVPTFQNPSGTVIPESRRRRILDLAHEHDLLIVEDDPYGALRFDGEPVPTMKSMDNEDRVLYLGTFSKILVPGFRLAWAAGPSELVHKMVVSKQSVDLCTNAFTQFIAADMLSTGVIDRHLPNIINNYRTKRDAMLGAMDQHFPTEGVSWTKSQGGMFTWAEMPDQVDTTKMLEKAIEQKVAYVPGKPFYADPNIGHNTMRLNFTHPSVESIEIGIERLGGIMAEELNGAAITA